MLDILHLPGPNVDGGPQVFRALGSSDWQSWRKPRGAKLIYIFTLGPGAGGGGGCTGAAATARGGGGGGGAGGFAQLMLPAYAIPDQLFVSVGVGGAGGAAGAAGSAGGNSIVSTQPTSMTGTNVLASHGSVAAGGGAGTAAAAGTAGAGATAIGRYPWNAMGQFSASAGVAGSAGGAQTGAVGANLTNSLIVCGGLGGGGVGTANTDFAGGQFLTAGGIVPTLPGGTAGGGAGRDGFEVRPSGMYAPIGFVALPGTGGGTAGAAGTGGKGGLGGLGCGGGGGGGGVTGGAGGRGGDGLVIIMAM